MLTGVLARRKRAPWPASRPGATPSTGDARRRRDYSDRVHGKYADHHPRGLDRLADPQTKVYGTNDLGLTDCRDGPRRHNGERRDDRRHRRNGPDRALARAKSGTLAREQAGGYAITQGTLAASEYAVGLTGSTLTITPAALIVAANPQTKVYGTNDPTLTVNTSGIVHATVDGIAIDDNLATVLTGSPARGAVGHPGRRAGRPLRHRTGHARRQQRLHDKLTDGILTIAPAALTLAANPQTKVYGTDDPTLTVTPTGLVDTTVDGLAIDDTTSSVLTGHLSRALSGTVAGEQTGGPYAITQGTLAANGNYTMSFTGSSLIISPATLAVTADPQAKVYGTNDPSLTDTATGFVDTTVDGLSIDDTPQRS